MYATNLSFKVITPIRPLLDPDKPMTAKIRYRTNPVEVQISLAEDKKTGEALFSSPVWGVTPGQSVVLYQDNLLIGGGIIL